MKKLLGIICLILITILALGVSATPIDLAGKTAITKTVQPTGGFSDTFTIENNGTSALTDLKIQRVGTQLNDFNISTTPHSLGATFPSLAVNDTVTITLTGVVPDDITTRDSAYTDVLKIYSGSTEVGSIDLKITAESQLMLDNVKFLVDGKSKSISEGDTRKDVSPGSKLEIKGDIENRFSDDDDIDIEDVTIEITIEKIDDDGDDDLDGDEDVGDINADDEESFRIEFEIPEDVDEGDYDVIITVEGDDENGASHSFEWDDVKIKVEKDKHDIWITEASVSPSKVACSRKIDVDLELKNQGTSDEDEVVVIIENSALDIDHEATSIPELEEGTGDDTEYDKSYSFVVGSKVKAGTYPVTIKVYYDTDTLSDTETVDVVVQNCEVEEEEEDEEVIVISPPTVSDDEEGPEILTGDVSETTEVSLFESNTYMLFLFGAIGLAVVIVIIMVVVLFSMKKKV